LLDIQTVERRVIDLQTDKVHILHRDYGAGKQIPNQSIRPQAYLPNCGQPGLSSAFWEKANIYLLDQNK
jgi:hypothetical protein